MISHRSAALFACCALFAAAAGAEPQKPKNQPTPPHPAQTEAAKKEAAKKEAAKKEAAAQEARKLEQRTLHQLRLDSPEKFEAMVKLRKTDYAKYKAELERLKLEQQKKLDDFNRLVKAYRDKPGDGLKKEIRAQLAEAYDKVTHWKKGEMERAEKWAKKQREEYQRRVEQRDRELDAQLEKLTSKRAKQW